MPADAKFLPFFNELKTQFAPSFYSTDADELKSFGKDWTRVYEPNPSLIVFPKDTQEVSKLLKLLCATQVLQIPTNPKQTSNTAGTISHQSSFFN